jgi:fatty acid desaturase
MSYIDTNHLLCPLTRNVNDPLANSLTVRSPGYIEALHLQFGFHVEHHVFPTMSGVHLPRLAAVIKETWPDRYNEMAHAKAIALLYGTPRIYQSDSVLVDPRTGRSSPTLPDLRSTRKMPPCAAES